MIVFPASAPEQLEFDQVKNLLANYCQTAYAKEKAFTLRLHTVREPIERSLRQTEEYGVLMHSGSVPPNDFSHTLHRELQLLSVPGSMLSEPQWMLIRQLAANMGGLFRWFNAARRSDFPALAVLLDHTYYEPEIVRKIDLVIDVQGAVRDNASSELMDVRQRLQATRNSLRRMFDRIAARHAKAGYLADISESFMNRRRVLAVNAANKRMIGGILHGESDSGRTAFIEPEETIPLNNELFSLESEELAAIRRILRQLTADINPYAALLRTYSERTGEFDLVRAKARLAADMGANRPKLSDHAGIRLLQAYHPLLYLINKRNNKPVVPLNITLDRQNRILVISGPNAGGKTVTLKTVGLLQLMLQSGLPVPVHPDSEMGVFRQLLIHIGDTQSIEFELSTYSAHLLHMKHFIEEANGKTLFFIDELGSGSDPALGGAFAEVIIGELARKQSIGLVTTHYLNLKLMAGKVPGVLNGAMQFDEEKMQPRYMLEVGKPGSSYTFSIAERIGFDKKLIARARGLVSNDQYRLDNLLADVSRQLQQLKVERAELRQLQQENERLKADMERTLNRERHRQEMERMRLQQRQSKEKLDLLKDLERKLKAMITEWRKTDDKPKAIKAIQALLYARHSLPALQPVKNGSVEQPVPLAGDLRVGDRVMLKNTGQPAVVRELRGKKVIVLLGALPMTVLLSDLYMPRNPETRAT
jgi:DNA mismatch repair protein MutS2